MSEELVIRHCAPTLAGIKTGNLFTCPFESRERLIKDIRAMNRTLVPKGLRVLPLRYWSGRALIYVFRPKELKCDLCQADAACLLSGFGYETGGCDQCVKVLISRLNAGEEFPHEIGLFLGYPPEDVRGFVENRSRNFKCAGYWKVYGDEAAARQRFSQYDKCTTCYCKQFRCGASIDRLAVNV